jgi:CheY-like chemotaxis protein
MTPTTQPNENRRLTTQLTVENTSATTSKHLLLVIDDDLIMRKLLKAYGDTLGYQVATAGDGETGLELAKQLHPAAILLDVMMPGMDGWMVLSLLKKDPELANIPIIMISIVEDKVLGQALGATEYLTKPLKRKELNTILEKYLDRDDIHEVLLVEDDPMFREIMEDTLKDAGLQVYSAENGREALDQLQHKKPHLILSDLIMPEMDGFEFITHLRQNSAWQSIPVVVLTSRNITPDEHNRLTHGVDKIFQKGSYRIEDLLDEIKTCLLKKTGSG